MKISHLRISNVLGISELEFDCGAFNVIEGPNGSGKSSVLEAVQSVFKGGEDATLLRAGQERGEIVLVLDDGAEIRKRVTTKGQPVTLERDGVRVDRPQTVIKNLIDKLSVNPVEFLKAKPENRVSVLLACLPIQADADRLEQIAGEAAKVADPEAPALAQIEAVHKAIYDDRTGTNRAKTAKEASISQLAATLPHDSVGHVLIQDDEATLQARLDHLDEAKDAEMARIENKLAALREAHEAEINQKREAIAALQAEIAEKSEAFAATQGLASQQRERSLERWRAERAPPAETLASLKANRDAAARAVVTREHIQNLRKEADELQADSETQTARLEALIAYKSELLASLPIRGLEVRDGEIYRDGVVFDRLNKAQQVEIAVEIAKIRSGDLGVICVDDLEMLDTEHFEAFRDQAIASGIQLFVTRVRDGAFAASAHS